jgi:NADPH2:quinone reductase
MRAVRFHDHGPADVLQVDTVERPTPAAAEVLIEVHASCVNPIDTKIRAGQPTPPGGLPQTVGSDVAGTVAAVGDEVEQFAVGDRVVGTGFGLADPGTTAEYVAVDADRLAPLPTGVDATDAAAAAMVFSTAWRALIDRGELQAGEVCLIHGATGGVGHAAVQVADAAGATVIGTVRSDAAAAALQSWGATPLRTDEPPLSEQLTAAAPEGVDVVLDPFPEAHLATDLDVLARGGRVVVISQHGDVTLSAGQTFGAMLGDHTLTFMSIMASADEHSRLLGEVVDGLEDGRFHPVIAHRYRLAETADAHRALEAGGTTGKLAIEIG